MFTAFSFRSYGDLGELNIETWAQGATIHCACTSPPGVEQVVGGFAQLTRSMKAIALAASNRAAADAVSELADAADDL